VTDQATAIKGAKITRENGVDFVVVRISEMFGDQAPTIEQLAAKVRLDTRVTLDALTNLSVNSQARESLFLDQLGDPDEDAPSPRQQRLRLQKAAITYADSASGRNRKVVSEPYKVWTVFPSGDTPIVLPLSSNFRRVLSETAKEAAEREHRAKVNAVDFAFLRADLIVIDITSNRLGAAIKKLDRELKPLKQEFVFIQAMRNLLAIMGDEPKGGLLPDEGTQGEMVQLTKRVDRLVATARQEMLFDSPDPDIRAIRDEIKKHAEQLRKDLASAVKNLKVYAANSDVAPAQLHQRIPEVLQEAYTNLLNTPLASDVILQEIVPLIDILAAANVPKVSVDGLNPDFEKGLNTVPSAGAADTPLKILGSMVAASTIAVGNLPGPPSLCVAIVAVAQSQLQLALRLNPARLREFSGKLTRVAFVTGGLSPERCNEVARAVSGGNLRALADMDWTKYLQTGPKMAGFLAILYFVTLCQVVSENDSDTWRKMANIFANFANFSLGVAQAMSNMSRLSNVKSVSALGMGNVGAVVGTIAAVAAIVVSARTVMQEMQNNDVNGAILAGVGGISGLLTVGGFAYAALATGTEAAIATAAALGATLQLVGVVVGIALVAITLGIDLLTPGTKKVFEGLLEHVSRDDGLLRQVAAQRPALDAALTDVLRNHEGVTFWDISPDMIQRLADEGYTNEHIAELIDEDILFVKARDPKRSP
jgi:hypothetical protein